MSLSLISILISIKSDRRPLRGGPIDKSISRGGGILLLPYPIIGVGPLTAEAATWTERRSPVLPCQAFKYLIVLFPNICMQMYCRNTS